MGHFVPQIRKKVDDFIVICLYDVIVIFMYRNTWNFYWIKLKFGLKVDFGA